MRKLKNGFTIAEMLICLVVAGGLAAMLIPSIVHKRPDKNKAMYRKAYYIAERVAAELTMDEDQFPGEGDGAKGFAFYDGTTRTQANTGKYFCEEFAKKISTSGSISCTTKSAPVDGTALTDTDVSFTTNDGVQWIVTPTIICDPDFETTGCNMPTTAVPPCTVGSATAKRPYACLFVDVNGKEGPNKMVYYGAGDASNDKQNADRSWIYVYYNGKVQVLRGQSARYLKSTSVF